MKIPKMLLIAGIVLMVVGCTSDRPWIGTYALEITEENKEMYDMFLEMGMVWPEITLNEDGTFVTHKTEGGVKISGNYTVEGTTLTIYAQEVDSKEPEGKYAEPHKALFEENFQVLMMEGPDKERWIRKEANESFLKGE